MIVSSCLSAVFLVILASQVRWSWAPDWLTPVAVLSFCCVNQSGVAIVPFMQMSESFVPKVRSRSQDNIIESFYVQLICPEALLSIDELESEAAAAACAL